LEGFEPEDGGKRKKLRLGKDKQKLSSRGKTQRDSGRKRAQKKVKRVEKSPAKKSKTPKAGQKYAGNILLKRQNKRKKERNKKEWKKKNALPICRGFQEQNTRIVVRASEGVELKKRKGEITKKRVGCPDRNELLKKKNPKKR